MNNFFAQAQEAAKQWTQLSTAFAQEQAKLFQMPVSGAAAPDAGALMAGFSRAAEQADDFVVKAVKMLDAQSAQLLDASLEGNAAKDTLAPVVASYKSASQAVVAAVEQLVQARKALFDQSRAG